MTTKKLPKRSARILLQIATILEKLRKPENTFDQNSWCGTACCAFGHGYLKIPEIRRAFRSEWGALFLKKGSEGFTYVDINKFFKYPVHGLFGVSGEKTNLRKAAEIRAFVKEHS